jgi:uncharacterized protein (TIGR02453 family)
MADCGFTPETFGFLAALAANNQREWFEAHRQDYEAAVRTPALAFIDAMASELAMISPHFPALAKKVGGSLMRIHRDTRFGRDKRPYKTNIGIHFRHELGRDVHAPGYYVHIEPGECFAGVGIWRPDADALAKIRDAIVTNGKAWRAARDDQDFRKLFTLGGEALARPPRGYAKDHPLIADLKRKDFIAIAAFDDKRVTAKRFPASVAEYFHRATPYMHFLCKALELRF